LRAILFFVVRLKILFILRLFHIRGIVILIVGRATWHSYCR
jgi:hypothetical protein